MGELTPRRPAYPSSKNLFGSTLRIIRAGPLLTNALRALAGTHPLSYYSGGPGMRGDAKFIATKRKEPATYDYRPLEGLGTDLSFGGI